MHDIMQPHCAYCEHFQLCFRTDMVTEWGYCEIKVEDKHHLSREVEIIKHKVESGDYKMLLDRAEVLGLFVPTYTTCNHFYDTYLA
ncbi:hypothetical protein ACFLWV_00245 [Chloroflexota bacterium]